MTDSRLDSYWPAARCGRSRELTEDAACCIAATRSGSRELRRAGDGADIIDNSGELTIVMSDSVARVKVVRLISYCFGPVTNDFSGAPGSPATASCSYGSRT
jgi:hypothetical protein